MTNEFETRGVVTVIILVYKGQRLECLIDTVDLPLVERFPGTWYAAWSSDSQTFYVIGRAREKSVLLHRYITDAPLGQEVDHVNHYGLDNRRSQLDVCGRVKNALNRSGANRNSKSGFSGVYWHKKTGKWRAQSYVSGRRRDLPGGFATAQEAADYLGQLAVQQMLVDQKQPQDKADVEFSF